MKLSMNINYSGDFHADVQKVVDLEKAGLDVVWVPEAYSFDAVSQMGYLAAKTDTIEIGSGILNVFSRTATCMAQTAAGLDFVSNGRFILGLGAGYHKTEFFALGVDFDERNALFDEALELLPKAWSGEPFDADGIHFTAKGVIQRPRPAQVPIPIWIGGNSKLSRRRAATVQGWMPMGIPEEVARTTRSPHISGLEQLADMIAEVKDLAGDRAGELDFCMSYMEEGIHTPTEDVDRHFAELGKMEAAGVTYVNIGHPPTTPQQMLDFIAAFGETYITN